MYLIEDSVHEYSSIEKMRESINNLLHDAPFLVQVILVILEHIHQQMTMIDSIKVPNFDVQQKEEKMAEKEE